MELPLIPGTLSSNCYPANPQTLYTEMFSRGAVQVDALNGVIISESAPEPEDRDKMWVKVDSSGIPLGQFIYGNGQWEWPHEVPPSSPCRWLWVGDLTALATFDGGNVGSAPYAGPFWEVDNDFAGRSPMAPGLIPSANPAKTLSVGENYGEGAHTQTIEEVGPHTHPLSPRDELEGTGSGDIEGITVSGTGPSVGTLIAAQNEYTTDQQAMPVIHPVRGIYIIKRTARIYRTP